jgi:hypothetical protein
VYNNKHLECVVVGQCRMDNCKKSSDAALLEPEGKFSAGFCRAHAEALASELNEGTGETWTVQIIDPRGHRLDTLEREIKSFEHWQKEANVSASMRASIFINEGRVL